VQCDSKQANHERKLATLLQHRAEFVAFVRKHASAAGTDDAEDIVQSSFLRAMEKLGTIRQDESIVAWFYRVLRNAIIDHYRRSSADEKKTQAFLADWSEESPLSFQIHQQICQCILPIVDELKPEYRDALKIIDIAEQPLRTLAAEQGISENNAAVRLHRARQALRKEVKITCGTCATHGCLDCKCKPRP
jgi:RNA polymerase sigma-70 factor (ECF subfamily)